MKVSLNIKKDFVAINDKILNITIFATALFVIPTVIVSLSRISVTGMKANFIFQIIAIFVVWALFLFRRRIPFKTRFILFILIPITTTILGIHNLGILGFWGYIVMIYSFLLCIFFGKKQGILTIAISIVYILIIGYLYKINWISYDFNIVEYTLDYRTWMASAISLGFYSIIITYSTGKYREYFLSTINELSIARDKAEESNNLKTEFLHNMSHEIRTPLNGIMGFSKMLTNPNCSDEKKAHYANIINNSGLQLIRIIDDILEISKLETNQATPFNSQICINKLLLQLFGNFEDIAREKDIPIYISKGLNDNESTVYTDKIKLYTILRNLTENAFKFTNKGFIEIGYHLKQTELEFFVKDTGVGIRPEKQSKIFERFLKVGIELSNNYGGLGLGLSIAKENAELLGGKISLMSEKGKGSTFYLTIPYYPVFTMDNNSVRIENFTSDEQDKFTILIAEDEEVNYLYIETLLDEMELDFNIHYVKNGHDAVDICRRNPNINLVLMDIKMPLLNGYEATKLIKEHNPKIQIIAQTAYTSDIERNKATFAGFDDFITKPIKEDKFNDIIRKFLNTKKSKKIYKS